MFVSLRVCIYVCVYLFIYVRVSAYTHAGNMVAVSLYVIGFCETLVSQLGSVYSLMGDDLMDIRVYGLILLTLLLVMALIGVGWIMNLQLGLLVLLVMAIISFMLGTFFTEDADAGIVGWSNNVISENLGPDYQVCRRVIAYACAYLCIPVSTYA